jgi:hypothetical protein
VQKVLNAKDYYGQRDKYTAHSYQRALAFPAPSIYCISRKNPAYAAERHLAEDNRPITKSAMPAAHIATSVRKISKNVARMV